MARRRAGPADRRAGRYQPGSCAGAARCFMLSGCSPLGASLAAGGFADAQLRTLTRHTIMLARPLGPARIEATVTENDALAPGQGAQLLLDNLSIEGLSPTQTPQRLRLRVRGNVALQPGDRIAVLASLTPAGAA